MYIPFRLPGNTACKNQKLNVANSPAYLYDQYYIKPKQICEISQDISKRILCLPLYVGIEKFSQNKIMEILRKNYD